MSATKVAEWGIGKLIRKVPYVGWAYSMTKLIKSVVDDHTAKQLEEVRQLEACPHIKDCVSYGLSGMGINAQVAANDGKTAWEALNGLWVYHDQPDYKPLHARQVYRPLGKGTWGAQGGGWGRPITGTSCRRCTAIRAQR